MPAAASLSTGALPIGLAHRVKLKNDIAHGALVRWSDVEVDADDDAVQTRRAMETQFAVLPILTDTATWTRQEYRDQRIDRNSGLPA